jgi:SAM-dependent methyltransferase
MSSVPKQPPHDAQKWQRDVWDTVSKMYVEGVEPRFVPIANGMLRRAGLKAGERVLDLGCGAGALTLRAAELVGPSGRVDAVDISPEMLRVARSRVADAGFSNVHFHHGGAEALPLPQHTADAMLAGMSLMFVLDRAAGAREMARVLRPGGRLVAAFPTGLDTCELVKFQRIIGAYAPEPPVKGVGPGALADPAPLVENLAENGIKAGVETEDCDFEMADFQQTWDIFAYVTATQMTPEGREAAKADVRRQMWPHGDGPRRFRNLIQFLVGERS